MPPYKPASITYADLRPQGGAFCCRKGENQRAGMFGNGGIGMPPYKPASITYTDLRPQGGAFYCRDGEPEWGCVECLIKGMFGQQHPTNSLFERLVFPGKNKYRTQVVNGLENVLYGLKCLFDGSNKGKSIIMVSKE